MSPDVKSPTREVVTGFEETEIATQGDGQVAPSGIDSVGGSFFNTENSENRRVSIEYGELDAAADLVRQSVREEAYNLIHYEVREEAYERNRFLLDKANINVHDTDHQDRDAWIVHKIFEAFARKLDSRSREPAILATMFHDREYIPAARDFTRKQLHALAPLDEKEDSDVMYSFEELHRAYYRRKWNTLLGELKLLETLPLDQLHTLWPNGSFPTSINKSALDSHAGLGEQLARNITKDPHFAPMWSPWSEQQKEDFAVTIRDHSNGSAYDSLDSSLESRVLRLADKVDNTFKRVDESMLNAHTLKDPAKHHRYVPTAIRDMAIDINPDDQVFTVYYKVDPSKVEEVMARSVEGFTYTQQDFEHDFDRAYGEKSMRIASEVFASLCAEDGEMYSDKSVFQVCLEYTNGTQKMMQYEKLVPSSVYEARGES